MIKRIFALAACFFILSGTLSIGAFSVSAEKDYSHLKGTTLNVYNWGVYFRRLRRHYGCQ